MTEDRNEQGLEKIFNRLKKIPKTSWKRSPPPYWTEKSEYREKPSGSRSITYSTKYGGTSVEISQFTSWHTEYRAETDWNNSSSWQTTTYRYRLALAKGLKRESISGDKDSQIHNLFENYFEKEVRDYLVGKVESRKQENEAKKERDNKRKFSSKMKKLLNILK